MISGLIDFSLQADDEYMLSDVDLFVNRYISVPKDMGQLNCAAFIAGILKGALQGAGFPARQATQSYSQPMQQKLCPVQMRMWSCEIVS